MDQLFRKQVPVDDVDPTITAETKAVMLIVQHNTFFNLMDHLSSFIKREYKDSPTAEFFSCGRTKTAAIVNCMGDNFFEELKADMQENPFSIMLDTSNDTGVQKMFPMTVRIFDTCFSRIMTKLFDINLSGGQGCIGS